MRSSAVPRALAAVFGATLFLGILAPAAQAAPPANDEISNARVITSVPTTVTVNTTNATFNAATDVGGYPCMGGHSVWLKFRPTATVKARIITPEADFDAMLGVFRGPANNLTTVACQDDSVVGPAVEVTFQANTTYFIAVSSCCDETAGTGGSATLRFYLPKVLAVADPVTSARAGNVSGRALLGGTVRCTNPGYVDIYVNLSQRVGSLVARGDGYLGTRCERTKQSWSLSIDSATGNAFRPGKVSVTMATYGYDGFNEVVTIVTSTMRLGNAPNGRIVLRG
jgi:hypothetical protein